MEDSQSENTKVCENCSKRFPQQKIDLHQAYCRRNIKKCQICFQMYDINDQEGHDVQFCLKKKQFHSQKECRYCSMSFPQKQWQTHQPSCRKRPVTCKFCQNDIAYEEVLKHEDGCGGRTTQCEKCRKYVPLREIDVHTVTCTQERLSPARNHPPVRNLSRDELRQNIRDLPPNLVRIRSTNERAPQQPYRRPYQNGNNNRQLAPSYEQPLRRQQRGSNQRLNVISADRQQKPSFKDKPQVNFQANIKPSHMIERQRIREVIDPVPISIRLAMTKINKKAPLQNRN